MSIIILSQTAVTIGKQLAEVRKMRVNTHVDRKGVAVQSTWRDTTAADATSILDAVETLKAQGYAVVEDKRPVRVVGTKKYTTRIIRLTKMADQAEEARPEPTPEPKKAGKTRKTGRRGAQQSTPEGGGKKNVEQLEEQLA